MYNNPPDHIQSLPANEIASPGVEGDGNLGRDAFPGNAPKCSVPYLGLNSIRLRWCQGPGSTTTFYCAQVYLIISREFQGCNMLLVFTQ